METQKIAPGKFAMNYGLLLGAVMIVIGIFMYATDMPFKGQQWPQYIYYIVFPTVIFIAINKYKQHSAGVLTLGEAIKLGLAIALISALVYIVYGIVFNYVIDPGYNAEVMDHWTNEIAKMDIPVEQKEMQLKVMEFFSSPINGSLFWIAASLIFGLIYSLIGGLIMKNDNAS